jgi:hypothetical protein
MVSPATQLNHLDHLALQIERLRDAELLPDAEAATLLTAVQTARHCLVAGDAPAAQRHVAHLVRRAEALIRRHVLAPADGRALIDTARRILTEQTEQTGQTD